MPAYFKVRILRAIAPAFLLTDGEWAEVVDFDYAARDDYTGERVLTFASEDEAAEAGTAYCDEAPNHPVFGAPGFEVVR